MLARKTSLKRSKSTLKRKPFSAKSATGAKVKKKKQSKADILRSWFMPEKYSWSSLRYKNPYQKGIYWYYISLYVRQRDVKKYGTCISCGKPISIDTCDAGHFIPAGSCGRDLLFDLLNINAECGRCNAWDEGHLFGYERGLVDRYGKDAMLSLKDRYFLYKNRDKTLPTIKDWKASEYEEKIKALNSYQQIKLQNEKSVV